MLVDHSSDSNTDCPTHLSVHCSNTFAKSTGLSWRTTLLAAVAAGRVVAVVAVAVAAVVDDVVVVDVAVAVVADLPILVWGS